MDSNVLEREQGITVFAKNAAIRIEDVKVNWSIPPAADFSSKVERTLSMADGCLPARRRPPKSPLPQTRFVLGLALRAWGCVRWWW